MLSKSFGLLHIKWATQESRYLASFENPPPMPPPPRRNFSRASGFYRQQSIWVLALIHTRLG